MDILLHAAGLAFIPLMAYMVIGGMGDIWTALNEYYDSQGVTARFRHALNRRIRHPGLSLSAGRAPTQISAPAPGAP